MRRVFGLTIRECLLFAMFSSKLSIMTLVSFYLPQGTVKAYTAFTPNLVPTERHPKSHRGKAVVSLKAPKFLTQ